MKARMRFGTSLVILLLFCGAARADRVQVIGFDSEWAYRNTGGDPGKGWIAADFDDSSWPKGLGVSLSSKSSSKEKKLPKLSFAFKKDEQPPTTYYFRGKFRIQDASKLTAMSMEVCYGSGFAVYINGDEVLRHNLKKNASARDHALPPDYPKHITVLSHGIGQEVFTGMATNCLKTGTNVIAVEMHLGEEKMERTSFGLRLHTSTGFEIVKGPFLQIVKSSSATVMWETNIPATSEFVCGDRKASDKALKTVHVMEVAGLKPDTRYEYEARSTQDRTSPKTVAGKGAFQTAPEDDRPFTWVAYGDSRSEPETHSKIAANILKSKPALVVNTGDLATTGVDYEMWETQFFRPLAEIAKKIPIYITPGNHEKNHVNLYNFFATCGDRSWYSFDYGNCHFLLIDTNVDFAEGSEQYKFIDNDLAKSKATWKMAFFHQPPRTVAPKRMTDEPKKTETILCPLFERHKVDMVFNGHDHHYVRSKKINGIVYVTTGGGGAPLYECVPTDFSEVVAQAHHHCQIDVDRKKITVTAIDIDGKKIDRFEVAK